MDGTDRELGDTSKPVMKGLLQSRGRKRFNNVAPLVNDRVGKVLLCRLWRHIRTMLNSEMQKIKTIKQPRGNWTGECLFYDATKNDV